MNITSLLNQFKAKLNNLVDRFTLLNLLTILGVLLAFTGTLWFLNRTPKVVEAGWFNDNWLYRKSIQVNNNTSEETDVYISVTIDTSDADKFQDDCGDIRFTKTNGQQLDYYVSSGCGTASTVIHVNFDTLPAGDQTLYYYYGNPSASDGFSASDFSTEASDYTVGSIGSEEQSPGPVAYWKFDEGYGDTAHDSTQNANHGTLQNSPAWQSEDMCVNGKCLYFNGSDSHIDVPSDPSISPGTSDFSLSAWVKTPNTLSNDRILSNHYLQWELWSGSDGNVLSSIGDKSNRIISYGPNIEDNKWHHITATYDRDGLMKLYVDGVLEDSDDISSYSTVDLDSNSVSIGSHAGGTGYVWNGFIDEPKIYPYARSAEEIKSDYASRGSAHGISADFGTDSHGYLNDGLVGYWKMDEDSWDGTADEVIDSSGNENHGVGVGDTPPTTGAGKFGNAGVFDGEDDYIQIGNTSAGNMGTGDFSISAWIKTATTDFQRVIGKYENSDSPYYVVYISNNQIRLRMQTDSAGNTYYDSDTVTLSDDSWHMIQIVADRSQSSDTAYFYLDGENVGTADITSHEDSLDNNGDIEIAGGDFHFNGEIDEARVYNRALSPKEVRDLYNWAPRPVAYYNFDEGSGTNLYDRSGNGNNSDSFGGDPTWATGKFGKALELDGNDDYINCGTNSLDFNPGSTPHTLSAWVYPTGTPQTYNYIMSIGNNSDGEQSSIGITNTNALYLSAYSSPIVTTDYTLPSLNRWYHISLIYSDGTADFYVDGVKVESESISVSTTTGKCRIGSHLGNSSFWQGKIDDVRIYNYARTQKQIVEDMNAGHPVGGSPVGSQVGYWKFDEGYGTTAYDSSPHGNDGTLTGTTLPEWTSDGKFGKAFNFNGGEERIDVGNIEAFDLFSQASTISFWIKKSNQERMIPMAKFHYDGGNSKGWMFDFDSNYSRVNIADGSGYAWQPQFGAIDDDTWYHITLTFDDSSRQAIPYTNGVQGNSVTIPEGEFVPASLYSMTIGSRPDSTTWNPMQGLIDEVKIYNSALTEDEIKIDYNRGKGTVFGSISTDSDGETPSNADSRGYCIPGDTSACSPPVAEWKFDEKQGTTAYDTSGNGNDGTLENGPTWKSAAHCKQGACLEFDGNNQWLTISDSGSSTLDLTSAGTLQIWAKSDRQYPSDDSNSHFRNFLSKSWGGQADSISYAFHWNGNNTSSRLRLCLSDGTNLDCDYYDIGPLTVGKWNHYATSWDGSNVKWYVNGKLVETDENTVTCQTSDNDFHIGGYTFSSGSNQHWEGMLDQAKVYDYARTPAQIAWDYNRGKPVGHWRLDECEGETANDVSGFGNHGSINIGASGPQTSAGTCSSGDTSHAWHNGADGKINSSLNFDGTDDYVDVDTSTSDNLFDITEQGTVALWTKINNHGSGLGLIGKYNSYGWADTNYGIVQRGDWAGETVQGAISDGTNNEWITSSTLEENVWYHIVFTFDGLQLRMYLNGQLDAQKSQNYIPKIDDDPIRIGSWGGGSGRSIDGQIDDVRIYNYALTEAQIKSLYNSNSSVYFGPEEGQP